MNQPYSGAEAPRFARNDATADAPTVAALRDEFGRWLRRNVGIDETRLCDVVLAVNEELANVAEFAYLDRDEPGTVDLEAVVDPRRTVLTVTVGDQGHWRDTDPLRTARNRGRGIPLMRTLADAVVIDTSALGTSVCLRFDNVGASRPAGLLTR